MPRRFVRDLISGNVFQLPGSAKVLEAAEVMAERRIGAILIIEEGKLRGIFTERDALCRVMAKCRDPAMTPLSGVMTPNPKAVSPDVRATEALLLMHDGGYRHLPVIEDGIVVGIVSLRDFAGAELQEVEGQLEFAERIAEA